MRETIPTKLTRKFYRMTIRLVILYDCECSIDLSNPKNDVAEMRILRWMSGKTH